MKQADPVARLVVKLSPADRRLLRGWLVAPCKWDFMCAISLTEAVRMVDLLKMAGDAGIDLTPPRPAALMEGVAKREARRRELRQNQQQAA